MTYNPEQAQRLFAALTGIPSPSVTWQTFCDFADDRDDLVRKWFGPIAPDYLADLQTMGAGIFYCVNGSSTGGRKASEIDQFRAVFMDSDGAPMPAQWVVPPHAITMRDDTHYHAYWFIDGDCSPDEWRFAQKTIALHYGSDETMVNPDRVLRVPGYWHKKDLMNPHQYQLAYLNEQQPRYKLREIIGYFQLDAQRQQVLMDWVNQRAGRLLAGADDYNDADANIKQFIEYLTQRALPSIQGQGGDHVCFKVACAGKDYGLSPEKAYECMWHYWDARNSPPWGEEMWGKIVHAYTYSQNKLGARSFTLQLEKPVVAIAGMSAEPVGQVIYVPEVVPEKPEKIDYQERAQIIQGIAPGEMTHDMAQGFYAKNHTTNALTYIGLNSPNGEVVYFDEDIYTFDGKVYEKQNPGWLKSQLAMAMLHVTPSDSDLNGTVNVIKSHLLPVSPVRWPQWKSAPDRDTSGLIVFNNGMLDILTNEWFNHTPLLRARHCLPYDFDASATCPEWEKFLFSVWGNSEYEGLIELLQMWFGYMLTNDTSQQKMAIISGKPRSGKSTMMRVLENMLGEFNCGHISVEGFARDTMLERISSKMAAIVNDADDPAPNLRSAVVGNIKKIVGEDTISFDRKYKTSTDVFMTCRVNMTCNEFPSLSESSTAMLDRGLYFYLPVSHSGNEDIMLGVRLSKEKAGIVNWAIRGLEKLKARGRLKNLPCMESQIAVFSMQSSPLESFIKQQMIKEIGTHTNLMDIFRRYRAWDMQQGSSGVRNFQRFVKLFNAANHIELKLVGDDLYVQNFKLKEDHGDIPPEYAP